MASIQAEKERDYGRFPGSGAAHECNTAVFCDREGNAIEDCRLWPLRVAEAQILELNSERFEDSQSSGMLMRRVRWQTGQFNQFRSCLIG